MINAKAANRLWLWTQKKQYQLFIKNSKAVEAYQLKKLQHYMQKNKDTQFGQQHHFGNIKNYTDYVAKVPVSEWNGFQSYINQIANDQTNTQNTQNTQNILTEEKTTRFEETSGTTSYSKLIPYTPALLEEFQSAIACWMYALYKQSPNAFEGKAYWSISPATRQQKTTESGIPIGVADDSSYFNPFANWLLGKILAVPPNVSKKKANEFYLQSLAYLLAEEKLTFISAWSPSFLIAFDEFLKNNVDEILASNIFKNKASYQRKNYLKQILKNDLTWQELWQNLKVVSCWTDAQAHLQSQQLQLRLGDITIQGKGLLSTECVCSVPILKNQSPALSYLSHFYEFRNQNNGEVLLAHQLQKRKIYEIIVTTGGGLYRYATSDLIEVTSMFNQVPCFKFMGRKNRQSDLVGEKLTELQINKALKTIFKEQLNDIEWVFIASQKSGCSFYHYILNIEFKKSKESSEFEDIATQFEKLLFANPYYKEAVDLGQLKPLQIRTLLSGSRKKYLNYLKKTKQGKEAVIKNTTLVSSKEYELIKKL